MPFYQRVLGGQERIKDTCRAAAIKLIKVSLQGQARVFQCPASDYTVIGKNKKSGDNARPSDQGPSAVAAGLSRYLLHGRYRAGAAPSPEHGLGDHHR